ncbi:GH92 family glycosyl hydrolase [Flavobacteriaceae bacterium F89]|uniref:GH92 family glycosyl hydrolase n=1 Tax=Cerina litoralis TaxID=2874477 RepID=A0AAE3EXM4_9FLAO|nr:GH92 family glycosyl hydrolase [Cerina litoralis]MCG2462788.1 GH92 family glycosyl hydrolase [Cerina litoralis]
MLEFNDIPASKICIVLLLVYFSNFTFTYGQGKTIWEIGKADNNDSEFALAPSEYARFLEYDFGWEDKFYAVGFSDPKTDFPYVLPGATDEWGGTAGLSGIRPHVLNLLFGIEEAPTAGQYKLVVDILDCSKESPPLFKVTINGKSWKFLLEKGNGDTVLNGSIGQAKEQILVVPIDSGLLRKGGNEIQLTSIDGSWLVFDQVRLEGPSSTKLVQPTTVFLRNVTTADYEVSENGYRYQPLLVDVQYLKGTPKLSVQLDGTEVFSKSIESGRYTLEVPMDAVKSAKRSKYVVLVDGEPIENGTVNRESVPIISPANYVDTKMGSGHSRWMIAPGPWMPFGMVKLSPDNQNSEWQGGYQPTFENVGVFSHVHEWTMAGLGMLPTNGPLQIKVGDQRDPDSGYRSRIDKSTENAPLGYYSVFLSDYKIKAELTATTRCGFQRYTYPKDITTSRVMIDLQIPAEYSYNIKEATLQKVDGHRIEGFSHQITPNTWSGGVNQEYTVYFVIEFDRPIKKFGIWSNGKIIDRESINVKNPKDFGAFSEFDTHTDQVVQARTGISYVSIENAKMNLETEISGPFGWDFEEIRMNQEKVWNNLLGRVAITSNDKREKKRFYTNMYRALCSRNTFSDVDGSWIDATEKRQKLSDPNALALGCDAFWNTFWNLNQFWNLATPEWSSKWVKSQLAMYDANGWLAKGPAGMEYVPVMVAEHEIPLIVGAYQMGIRDYDAEKAFEAVHKMQTTPAEKVGDGLAGNRDLIPYLKYQYVPYDKGRFSNSLEYAFDDFAVAQLAKALGKKKEYEEFIGRAAWWKHIIDPESGYALMKKSDGTWFPDFDPFKSGANEHYVEGNAWQLTFFVPQDIPGLAQAIGKDRFIERLDWGFNESYKWRYNAPNELYWDYPIMQGNQQSMHFSYLFNWVQRPWLTQKWSRSILDRYYGYGVNNAYLGDEDQGQMSSWFAMSALGLFQTDGGTRVSPIYEIGSPIFKRVEIDLGEQYGRGKTFTIEAFNTSRKNIYIQSATLNGKALENFWFPSDELLKGGSLKLEMGPKPNKDWGADQLPPSSF